MCSVTVLTHLASSYLSEQQVDLSTDETQKVRAFRGITYYKLNTITNR